MPNPQTPYAPEVVYLLVSKIADTDKYHFGLTFENPLEFAKKRNLVPIGGEFATNPRTAVSFFAAHSGGFPSRPIVEYLFVPYEAKGKIHDVTFSVGRARANKTYTHAPKTTTQFEEWLNLKDQPRFTEILEDNADGWVVRVSYLRNAERDAGLNPKDPILEVFEVVEERIPRAHLEKALAPFDRASAREATKLIGSIALDALPEEEHAAVKKALEILTRVANPPYSLD